ncbi:transcription-repair coupling factor [Candidatus Marinimicrobia bacterium MT.SAG.2]|nr:transcription-repair coupling factor [Candidatus Marinimicrobia bacterium MT.SAG.2]
MTPGSKRISPTASIRDVEMIEELISSGDVHKKFIQKLSTHARIDISGVSGSLTSFLIKSAFHQTGECTLVAAPTLKDAEAIRDDLELLVGKEFVYFLPESGKSVGQEALTLLSFRSQALNSIQKGTPVILVTTFGGLTEFVTPPEKIIESSIDILVGKEINLHDLKLKLTDIGYESEKMVSRPFDFSIRGGIVDIFPISFEHPVRIEFFGDKIESMREFDVVTQISRKHIKNIRILPDLRLAIFANDGASGGILSVLPEQSLVWIEQEEKLELLNEKKSSLDLGLLRKEIARFRGINVKSFSSKDALDFCSLPQSGYGRSVNALSADLRKWSNLNDSIIISCENEIHMERMNNLIGEKDVLLLPIPMSGGFHLPSANFHLLTDHQIFDRHRKRRSFLSFSSFSAPIRHVAGIKIGDYLVHIEHGIGKYRGMEKINIQGAMRECLKIVYAGDDKIYLPVENFHRIQKYKTAEGITPKLNKIGTGEWERLKKNTKSSISKIARDLVELYAKRLNSKGFSFSGDEDMQWALESSFPYSETEDQLQAIEEVKSDMEKNYPMDRLLCGDVGFGKTEVALRAAFKCAINGKQTAILVPTTILAEQHFMTFKERLIPFPVNVESISRFRSKKEQSKILSRLAAGSVDILIGTHRLLSKDVIFKDLGLLIIDEEHRFGVRQKERLKEMRLSVDTLSMSATPIPRTLNFSLLGARDLSNINTAPKNRLPIYTEITSLEEGLVRDAILKEVERGGQVFFVHNEVKTIDKIYNILRKWVPQVRICVAHGQMRPKELEAIMSKFMAGEYEVLLSTMIIESGLDIPNVNTILVNRADKFGLSQLYQLRGRVGRSDRRAFAYLLIPPAHKLTETAIKRLKTLENFTQLGVGFNIAMQDLEIRGAGNLLGTKQSGFMEAVGYDMYNRLINEAVEEMKKSYGIETTSTFKVMTEIDCDIDAYFPETYIEDGETRIDLYRRMSSSITVSVVSSISSELLDRFGPMPNEARNLLELTNIKILASALQIKSISIKRSTLTGLIGNSDNISSNDEFFKILSRTNGIEQYNISIKAGEKTYLQAELDTNNTLESASSLLKLLSSSINLNR